MPSLPRSPDDLLLDGIVAKVSSSRDADAAVSSAFYFENLRDKTTPWQNLEHPLVVWEIETDIPERRPDYTVRIHGRAFVPTKDDNATAGLRFAMLKEQVRRAIMGLDNFDFGQAVGSIAIKTRPAWARIAFEDEKINQEILVGEWAFEISYAYSPAPLSGVALTEISVELLERFSALYPLGGS